MLTRSRSKFHELLKLAKEAYMMEEKEKIVIKMVDESRDSGDWRQVALKNRRSLATVITEGGLKEMLERDINQFCKAERWYSSRGVPWRRGYLLHGESMNREIGILVYNLVFLLIRRSWQRKDLFDSCSGVDLRSGHLCRFSGYGRVSRQSATASGSAINHRL